MMAVTSLSANGTLDPGVPLASARPATSTSEQRGCTIRDLDSSEVAPGSGPATRMRQALESVSRLLRQGGCGPALAQAREHLASLRRPYPFKYFQGLWRAQTLAERAGLFQVAQQSLDAAAHFRGRPVFESFLEGPLYRRAELLQVARRVGADGDVIVV